jgi:DNA-directed RNA polymerase subunit RPC12/RpoP
LSDGARDLLVRGIAAAKAGDRAEARHYLEWALRQEPDGEQELEAKLWLSETCEAPEEARRWLEDVLAGDPTNPRARRKLALLDGRLKREDLIDPDQPLPVSAELQSTVMDPDRFACPSCGGPMAFAPDGEGLQCDHCGTRLGVGTAADAGAAGENDFVMALATARGHAHPTRSRTLVCSACGAHFLLAPDTLSLTCPYCEAVYTVESGDVRMLAAPEAIIPIAIAENEAHRRVRTWIEGRQEPLRLERLVGIYLPVWLLEMGGVIEWSLPLSSRSTRLGEEDEVGTEPPASPIAVLASRRLAQQLAPAAEDLDADRLESFDPAFLASWPAETYSLSLSDAALRARQRSLELTTERLAARARGRKLALRTARMMVDSYRLVLTPVWLATLRAPEGSIELAINGTSGKLYAASPRHIS